MTGLDVSRRDLRVAVVGAGTMANLVHYPSLTSMPGVTIAGICDLDADRLNATGDLWGVPERYSDWRALVDDVEPDAVYVIGQPELMYGVWCEVLARGLNLFVEKPLGLTAHQARTLARLAAENSCITQVGFQRRNSPLLGAMLDAVLERGPVVTAVCRFYKDAITPMDGARDHMMDDGVHAIDTLRHLCGGEIVRITSTSRRVLVDDINLIAATLEFDNGAVGLLVNNWTSGRRTFGVEIHGSGILAEGDLETTATIWSDRTSRDLSAESVAGSGELYALGGFRAKSEEFMEAIREGRQPSSHFGDALKTMLAAETILAQAQLAEFP